MTASGPVGAVQTPRGKASINAAAKHAGSMSSQDRRRMHCRNNRGFAMVKHLIFIVALAAPLAALAPVAYAAENNAKVLAAAQAARSAQLQLLEQVVNVDSGTGDVVGG